jgi:glycosyltransferase involved in cell wall biosynthesis
MTTNLLLLLSSAEEDAKMASVRWKRFKKHLCPDEFLLEWVPIRLPFGSDSAGALSKALRELTVLRHAATCAKQLARDRNPRMKTIVVASIPTLDPLYVGAMLKRSAGSRVELVLEIRDVYARPELFEYSPIRRRLEILKEAMLVRYVDRFIFLTDEIKKRYCTYYPHLAGVRRGAVITNGYDSEEYGSGQAAEPRPGPLEIGYFGSFYATRTPELLFQALHLFQNTDPRGSGAMRVHLWGEPGNYPLHAKIAEYGLQDTVVYHGIGAHEDIIKQYTRAGVNLIITHRRGSGYALPGKLFEYMGAARPMWAITNDRMLRDFIARHELGYLSYHSVDSIARTLNVILRDHTRPGGLPSIRRLESFQVTSLTRQLEKFLTGGRVA